jgi:hypothetical protein
MRTRNMGLSRTTNGLFARTQNYLNTAWLCPTTSFVPLNPPPSENVHLWEISLPVGQTSIASKIMEICIACLSF